AVGMADWRLDLVEVDLEPLFAVDAVVGAAVLDDERRVVAVAFPQPVDHRLDLLAPGQHHDDAPGLDHPVGGPHLLPQRFGGEAHRSTSATRSSTDASQPNTGP